MASELWIVVIFGYRATCPAGLTGMHTEPIGRTHFNHLSRLCIKIIDFLQVIDLSGSTEVIRKKSGINRISNHKVEGSHLNGMGRDL